MRRVEPRAKVNLRRQSVCTLQSHGDARLVESCQFRGVRLTPPLAVFLAAVFPMACHSPAPQVVRPETRIRPASNPEREKQTPEEVDVEACGGRLRTTVEELECDLGGSAKLEASALAKLRSVRVVSIAGAPEDVSFLRSLPGVESLTFEDGVLGDLSPIRDLAKLEVLAVHGPMPRVETLEGLSGLRSLDLTRAVLPDLRPLTGSVGLRSLVLRWTDVPDLQAIESFEQLETLTIVAPSPPNHEGGPIDAGWEPRVDSLDFLASLDALREAEFRNLRLRGGCRGLSRAGSLEVLLLEGSGPCESFAVLSGLQELRTAELEDTQFSSTDLGVLADVPNLDLLSISGTGVTDVSPLARLPSLGYLAYRPRTAAERASLRKLMEAKPDLEVDDR